MLVQDKKPRPQPVETAGPRVVCIHRTADRPVCDVCARMMPRELAPGRYILARIAPAFA